MLRVIETGTQHRHVGRLQASRQRPGGEVECSACRCGPDQAGGVGAASVLGSEVEPPLEIVQEALTAEAPDLRREAGLRLLDKLLAEPPEILGCHLHRLPGRPRPFRALLRRLAAAAEGLLDLLPAAAPIATPDQQPPRDRDAP